jgi:hypothetical protein
MQIKKFAAGVAIAGTMGAGGLALAGTAAADSGQNGAAGAPGGSVTVTNTTNTNRVSLFNGNRLLNGTRLNVANGNLAGNRVVLSVSILNGPILSNNILNSGPSSFNTDNSRFWANNSFNTVTVTHDEVTTNNSGKPGAPGWPGGN